MTSTTPVRDIRMEMGITQADLARALQKQSRWRVTRQDINLMEAGKKTPKCRQLEIEALKYLAAQKQTLNDAIKILEE